MSNIKTLFLMEFKKFRNSKKLIFSTFLLGPIMIFFLLFFLQNTSTQNENILIIDEFTNNSFYSQFENIELSKNNNYEELVQKENNLVIIVNNHENIKIYFDSSKLQSQTLLTEAQKIASKIMANNINSDNYNHFEESIEIIEKININNSFDENILTLISMIFLITLITTTSNIGTLTIDSICGEKERGTFDTLRLSGAKLQEIIFSKFSFIAIIGFLSLLINIITIFITTINFFNY